MLSDDTLCFPLAEPQRRLLDLIGAGGDPSAYVSVLAHRVRGPLDLPRLRRALDALTDRHEPLRTAYPADEDGTVRQQRVGEPDALLWELTVVEQPSAAPGPPPPDDEDALLRAFAGRPFDLAHGPLGRVLVVRRAAEDHLVVLAVHLLAADGWSLRILLDELGAYYADAERAHALLPPLDVQYADWAHWQAAGRAPHPPAPRVPAPPAPRVPPPPSGGPGRRLRTAAVPVLEAERLARQERVPLFTVLLTAFALAARGPSTRHHVSADVPVAGRDHPQLVPLTGYFTRFHRLDVALTGDLTFRQALRRVHDAWAGAGETGTGAAAVPLFSYRSGDVQPRLRLEGCAVTVLPWLHDAAKTDLALITDRAGDVVHPMLEFRPSAVPERAAGRLGRRFAELLDGAAGAPDAPVDAVAEGRP